MAPLSINLVFSTHSLSRNFLKTSYRFAAQATAATNNQDDEFRVLVLYPSKNKAQQTYKKRTVKPTPPPRELRMPTDQNWTNVWPGPKTFHPASVPLPLRQGLNNLGPAPNKYGNAELMKIPNFLHLTPPAIKKQCAAIKKFCTKWPVELENDEDCRKHFPVEVTTSDYCHSSPSVRDPLARIVTVKIPLSTLPLDKHAKDKFLRLVGDRYDEESGIVTIVTDKCPVRNQNLDYAMYLFTALLHESWVVEPWEQEKIEEDYEFFDWEKSTSKENVEYLMKNSGKSDSELVDNYRKRVVSLFDEGETESSISEYTAASEKLLF